MNHFYKYNFSQTCKSVFLIPFRCTTKELKNTNLEIFNTGTNKQMKVNHW